MENLNRNSEPVTFYSIQEASEKLNLSQYTLRYYERDGLIPRVARRENGRRIYSENDMIWIQVIQCLRKTGMSMAHIKEYNRLIMMGDETISQRYDMVLQQKETIESQIKEFQEVLEVINYKLNHYAQYMKNTKQLLDS